MTEAGEKWVEVTIKPELDELRNEELLRIPGAEEHIREARLEHAEFWIRAFVAEVEKRSWVDTWARGDAFVKLARELLGDK